MRTLRESLAEWTDTDVAMHALAHALGIFPFAQSMGEQKGVYWSNNPLGDALHGQLELLVNAGILEKRDAPQDYQYRWNRISHQRNDDAA